MLRARNEVDTDGRRVFQMISKELDRHEFNGRKLQYYGPALRQLGTVAERYPPELVVDEDQEAWKINIGAGAEDDDRTLARRLVGEIQRLLSRGPAPSFA